MTIPNFLFGFLEDRRKQVDIIETLLMKLG